MNNFMLGSALILNSLCLLQTLWKHITSEDKFMILSRTTGAIIWNENQDKNVIVCIFCTKGSWRKFPLQSETWRCEWDLWSLSILAIGSSVSRGCCKEQGGVSTLLPLWWFAFNIFNHTFTKICWDLRLCWSRCSTHGPKGITLQPGVLRFVISPPLSSRRWYKRQGSIWQALPA